MSKIRLFQNADKQKIIDIYNQAVNHGFQTADTEETTLLQKVSWFEDHQSQKFPLYVCEIDRNVVGWISISPYRRGRNALRYTAEVSYYVDKNFQKQGIGSELLKYTLEKLPQLGIKSLFAILLDVNIVSVKLLERFGFNKWGHLPNIADFDGQICGQYYYGYQVDELITTDSTND